MYKIYKNQVSCCVANLLAVVTLAAWAFLFMPTQVTVAPSLVWSDPYLWPEIDHDIDSRELSIPAEVFAVSRPVLKHTEIPRSIVYSTNQSIELTKQERNCLIRNVFFESGGEPYEGKIAVAQVTWNRLQSGLWGRDLCRVVHAPRQFSWTADPNKRNRVIAGDRYTDVIAAVDDFIAGSRVNKLDDAMHFHATYVRPSWAKQDQRVKQIGGHVFYALK